MIFKNKYVYRILTLSEWENFKTKRKFQGNSIDLNSGFIHLSTKGQIMETRKKYFKVDETLVIVGFKFLEMKKFLKWEVSRNEKKFPHFYGSLYLKNVSTIKFVGNS